jgi:hypothetical protein
MQRSPDKARAKRSPFVALLIARRRAVLDGGGLGLRRERPAFGALLLDLGDRPLDRQKALRGRRVRGS